MLTVLVSPPRWMQAQGSGQSWCTMAGSHPQAFMHEANSQSLGIKGNHTKLPILTDLAIWRVQAQKENPGVSRQKTWGGGEGEGLPVDGCIWWRTYCSIARGRCLPLPACMEGEPWGHRPKSAAEPTGCGSNLGTWCLWPEKRQGLLEEHGKEDTVLHAAFHHWHHLVLGRGRLIDSSKVRI